MATQTTLQELPFYDAVPHHDELECELTSHKLINVHKIGPTRGYLRVCAGCGWAEYTPDSRDEILFRSDWDWLVHLSTVLTGNGDHLTLAFMNRPDRTLMLPVGIGDQEDITVFCEPDRCFEQSLSIRNMPSGTNVSAFHYLFGVWMEARRQDLLGEYLEMLATLDNCDDYIANALHLEFEYHPGQPSERSMELTHKCVKSIAHDRTYEEVRRIRRALTVIKPDEYCLPQDTIPDIYGVGMIIMHFTYLGTFLCARVVPVILTRKAVMNMPWYTFNQPYRPAELWRNLDESHSGQVPQPRPRQSAMAPVSFQREWELKVAEPSYWMTI